MLMIGSDHEKQPPGIFLVTRVTGPDSSMAARP